MLTFMNKWLNDYYKVEELLGIHFWQEKWVRMVTTATERVEYRHLFSTESSAASPNQHLNSGGTCKL